jgi:hypothetical protein
VVAPVKNKDLLSLPFATNQYTISPQICASDKACGIRTPVTFRARRRVNLFASVAVIAICQ